MDNKYLEKSRRCVRALGEKANELFPERPGDVPAGNVRTDDMAEFAHYVFDALDAIQQALES